MNEKDQKNLKCDMSGIPGLDEIVKCVQPGDNVVWQVDSIDDYLAFVLPFCDAAVRNGKPLIYFRFARHPELLPESFPAHVYSLHPESGFDAFISEIFDVIEEHGYGAYYLFDCLSDLAVDWYSDRMLGNFFMLTCPYLYDFETIAYFALMKNYHSSVAIDAIHDTAQIVLDVYSNREGLFVHPHKVEGRHSPTMYLPHAWVGEHFIPVTSSATITKLLAQVPHFWVNFTSQRLDVWTRTFMQAGETVQRAYAGSLPRQDLVEMFDRLLRMAITRDRRMEELARHHMDIDDILAISKRMIGTGLIGGKSVGMLVSRAILKFREPSLSKYMEDHDSFFVGSDVFYTYLVENGCWWLRRRMHNRDKMRETAAEARDKIMAGSFSPGIRTQFIEMLDYFGQSPIIVRSSSLLEDNYGNAFSGKYDSVFCANQGTPEERLEALLDAVRTVYASALSPAALEYREHWGLLEQDEQMALLIQRVSGVTYGHLYFPQAAGVGFSFNPYVWHEDIDPKEGLLRLVFGLGTRAVDRNDDDYTRIVALNAPEKRHEVDFDEVRKFAQRKVDVLNLATNSEESLSFKDVGGLVEGLPIEIFATPDRELLRQASEHPDKGIFPWVLTFSHLLSRTEFVPTMRRILSILQETYGGPVDIEFTVNFSNDEEPFVNLLQCRPLQIKESRRDKVQLESLGSRQNLLETRGPIVGNSIIAEISRVVYVAPGTYSKLSDRDRYILADVVGKVNHAGETEGRILLIGPGRWGTSTPSLGVPVTFSDIKTVAIMCELAIMHEGLIPEVSMGTHFFNDIIENDMLYVALYPGEEGHVFNEAELLARPNQLAEMLPEAARWAEVVHVADYPLTPEGPQLFAEMDVLAQKGSVFLANSK